MGWRTDLKSGYANRRTAIGLVADSSKHWERREETCTMDEYVNTG